MGSPEGRWDPPEADRLSLIIGGQAELFLNLALKKLLSQFSGGYSAHDFYVSDLASFI